LKGAGHESLCVRRDQWCRAQTGPQALRGRRNARTATAAFS
jgi:hypothetical protein